jgi:quercetin dioxygenase-like cupin family protein
MTRWSLAVPLVLAGLAASPAVAQDAAKVASENYSLLLDNDSVRVLDVRVAAGAKVPLHSHPDHVAYVLAGGKLKLTHPDGTAAEIEASAGQALFIPAEAHATENVGSSEVHVVIVELKPRAGSPPKPPATGALR